MAPPPTSTDIRRLILTLAHRAKSGHVGSALSCADILFALYFDFLKIDPKNPSWPERDRFILSKGHAASALYATLALRGFFKEEFLLEQYLKEGGPFPGHPSSKMLPGIEASTGSLGHGLPIGVGLALAIKRSGASHRTVVLVSDGECDEGSVWEAILAAGNWKLGSLTCIVDYNKIQSFGRVSDIMELEPFAEKWRAFKWHVQVADGHSVSALTSALKSTGTTPHQPSVIIANTVKGKGVSFMENTVDWHYWPPNDEQFALALRELSAAA